MKFKNEEVATFLEPEGHGSMETNNFLSVSISYDPKVWQYVLFDGTATAVSAIRP